MSSLLQDKLSKLPNDLKCDILHRLPVNYLYRCRSLSKLWMNLIQTPLLSRVQVKKTQPMINNRLIVIPGGGNRTSLYSLDFLSPENLTVASLMKLDYPMRDSEKQVNLVGTCNGLICIENTNICSDKAHYDYPSANTIFTLWNPFTGIYRIVGDKSDNTPLSWSTRDVDSIRSYCYFGYDHVKDDYHVVRVTQPNPPNWWQPRESPIHDYGFVLDVYSLKNDSWTKIINQEFQKEWTVYVASVVFTSGTLYLIGKPKENDNPPYYLMILAFDIATQTFRLVVVPSEYHGCFTTDLENILGELDGRLSVNKCPWLMVCKHLVWLMNGEEDDDGIKEEELRSKMFDFQTTDSESLVKLLPYSARQILGMVSCDKMIWCDPLTRLTTDILVEKPEGAECLMQREACVCSRTTVSPFLV